MANTGSGSLATILFFFIFPAALRKGRTLAGVRLCPRLALPLFLLSLSTFVAVVFGPIDGVQPHPLGFFSPERKEKKKKALGFGVLWLRGTMRSPIKLWNACFVYNAGRCLCICAAGKASVGETPLCL